MASGTTLTHVSAGVNRISGCATFSRGSHCQRETSHASAPASPTTTPTPPVYGGKYVSQPEARTAARRGIVAYASGHFVALYDPENAVLLCTLRGHRDRVNSVAWLSGKDPDSGKYLDETQLVSGSTDGTVAVWSRDPTGNEWRRDVVLACGGSSVSAVAATRLEDGVSIVAAATTAAGLHIFFNTTPGSSEWTALPAIDLGAVSAVEAMQFGRLPGFGARATLESGGVFLAAGGIDTCVHVWALRSGTTAPEFTDTGLSLPGHLDWVRCIDVSHAGMDPDAPDDVFIVSGSQDHKGRIWRLSASTSSSSSSSSSSSAPATPSAASASAPAATVDKLVEDLSRGPDSSRSFVVGTQEFTASLEALLVGHDNWLTSIRWAPPTWQGSTYVQPRLIVSASVDKSVILWQPEGLTGIWTAVAQVGELGGKTMGFFGAGLSPDLQLMVAHGFHGSLHVWRRDGLAGVGGDGGDDEEGEDGAIDWAGSSWLPGAQVSGHQGPVTDVCWGIHAKYLVSCSLDQTTRVWAELAPSSSSSSFPPSGVPRPELGASASPGTYYELARPQIHGYDVTCVAMMPSASCPHRLVSGADEKLLRVYDATSLFLSLLSNASPGSFVDHVPSPALGSSSSSSSGAGAGTSAGASASKADPVVRAEQAYVQELALSNKAFSAADAIRGSADVLPSEEELIGRSVWPETNKLYGHLNEVLSCAVSPDGSVVASSCKARDEAAASVIVWRPDNWRPIQRLPGHSLSVVQLEFSPDNRYLASVSKDRHFCVYGRRPGSMEMEHLASVKAHRRIVWSCSWSPDSRLLATGSRDKTVKVWAVGDGEGSDTAAPLSSLSCAATLPKFDTAVTAVAFDPHAPSYRLAVGLETGDIQLFAPVDGDASTWELVGTIPPYLCHTQSVKRLKWAPYPPTAGSGQDLASASDDGSVRVFSVL